MTPEVKITPIDVMTDGRVRDSVDFEIKTIELNKFVERLNVYYDTEAVFQRDFGWTLEMQAELIRSIMTGNPIGWCWLCENSENVAYKTMIDFKNRSLTIKRFWEGAFKVPLRLFKQDGTDEVVYMSWKEMCLSKSPQIKNLVQTFQDYPIQIIIFKGLDLVGMANKWKTVNTYLLMANEEHLYGGNFYVKGLYKAIFNHSIKEIMQRHARGRQEAYNEKEKGTIFSQRIFYTCFGPLLEDVWAIRCLGNSKSNKTDKPMVRDTDKLNKHLAEILQDEKVSCLDERFMRKTKFWNNVELMKKLTSHLIDVLDSNNPASKNLNKNDLFDIIVFSMKLILEGRLTFSMLRDNKNDYRELIADYLEQKKQDKTLTGQSVTTKKITERWDLFNKIWQAHIEDTGFKNQPLNKDDITLALLNSPSHCPISKEPIHDRNIEVDHLACKSKHSKTGAVVTSKTGNQWKSNLDDPQLRAILKYNEDNADHMTNILPTSPEKTESR